MTQPTIVLVHDAFTDASSWGTVIRELRGWGSAVVAPANPLAGLATDARYLCGVLRSIDGPVLLVGHGYGGAVITNVPAGLDHVIGLVYVAGFGLDLGESCNDVMVRFRTTALTASLRCGAAEVRVEEPYFHRTLAADLAADAALVMALTQRPIATAAAKEGSAYPAWTRLPSWYGVATRDEAVQPAAQRFMAHRMAANQIEIDSSHAVPMARPADVAELIQAASR
ncbi:alpha/beta hydrolase [Actinoplanes sp. RD1]|uniref:alpha/beta hydrolase n=1 Tax=Actinoplanes sp. RD1 TaxID=3064538 RepID=UPI0027429575|nr:alpha/beta hydrolase [Actinoplanes sp. RD1]